MSEITDKKEYTKETLRASLEALLFVYGEPISFAKAAAILKTDVGAVKEISVHIAEQLKTAHAGLQLVSVNDQISLTTAPEMAEMVNTVIKEELDTPLSPASLETLAIVAYKGPLTRAEIDFIRGVNSSFILRNLSVRGLVEKAVDAEKKHIVNYRVTTDFLKHLGLASLADLPEYGQIRKDIEACMAEPAVSDAAPLEIPKVQSEKDNNLFAEKPANEAPVETAPAAPEETHSADEPTNETAIGADQA